MKKIVLFTAVTIDGLIARRDGSIDWLDAYSPAPDGGDYGYSDFISGVDTTVMGAATYRKTKELGGMAHMAAFTNYVFSRSKEPVKDKHVTFVTEDVSGFVEGLRNKPGKNIWLIGGGQINAFLLEEHLIDEMILTTIPVVLGEGLPLFAPPAPECSFMLQSSKAFSNGVVQSIYTKRDSA